MKDNDMNQCKKCEQRYHIRGNAPGMCYSGPEPHEAKYDFTKDENDVLNCEI